MNFICQGSFHINSSNITGHQHTVTISEIHSFEEEDLVVLHKYFIKLKLLVCYNFFLRLHRTPQVFCVRRNP